jgi:hypothetical protein
MLIEKKIGGYNIYSRYWLSLASNSSIPYIVNDYVRYLSSTSNASDKVIATNLLRPLLKKNNPQSIRWYARILIDSKDEDKKIVGNLLLRYAATLGNEYANLDLIRIFGKNDVRPQY